MNRLVTLIIVTLLLNACTVPDVDFGTATATPEASPTIDPTPTREEGFRASFNMNGEDMDNAQRQFYQDYFVVTQPTTITVMNNSAWACQLAEVLPDTLIIDRRHSNLEGDEWREFIAPIGAAGNGPDEWVNQRLNQTPCSQTLIYSVNEPGLGDLSDLLDWEIDVMQLLQERGRRGVMGNFSSGSVSPDSVENGSFDDWYVALDEGGHFAGVHEYTSVILTWGFGRMPRSFLLEAAQVQPANWTRNFPVARIAFSQLDDDELGFGISEYLRLYEFNAETTSLILPPNWHLRRADWHIIRAIEQDLPPPSFILTEAFWDNMSDIDQHSDGLNPIAQLRNRYGIQRYNFDMRGVNSYQRLYESYFPFWDTAEAIFCQIVYMDYMYPREYYIGFNMFTISNHNHWISFAMTSREAGYYDKFYQLMEVYATEGDTSACGDYFWS